MDGIAVNPGVALWNLNAVLNGRNTNYIHTGIKGTFSVKTILSGAGWWHTPDGSYRVDEDSYLILNESQLYDIEIVTQRPVETFCLFFRPGFVAEVQRGRAASIDQALSEKGTDDFGFFERLNPKSETVGRAICRIRSRILDGDATQWEGEELFLNLAEALVSAEHGARAEAERLSMASGKNRAEVYRRLLRARDFIVANADKKITFEEAAKEAFLSPFHFHRLFTQAFGVTPNAFLQDHRLRKAQRMLREDNFEVREVAWAVGYESATTFHGLFRRRTGMTPLQYRELPSQD